MSLGICDSASWLALAICGNLDRPYGPDVRRLAKNDGSITLLRQLNSCVGKLSYLM